VTNANLQPRRFDALRRLEESLGGGSSRRQRTESSLEGAMAPALRPGPPTAVVPDRRAMEDADKRQNWMLLSPEEVAESGLGPDKLKSRESQPEEQKTSIFEQFLTETPDKKTTGTEKGSKKDNAFGAKEEDKSDVPEGMRESEKKLKKLLGKDETGPADPFGYGDRQPSKDYFSYGTARQPSQGMENNYVKQYRELIDAMGTPRTAGAAVNPYGLPQPYGSPMDAGRRAPNSTMGSINPRFDPNQSVDANRRVLNQWNPLYEPPKAAPYKRPTPPKPNFDAPRRSF
jgi:hypothetical protein